MMRSRREPLKWIALLLAPLFLGAGCAHEMRGFPPPEVAPSPLPRISPYDVEKPEGLEQRARDIQVMLENNRLSLEDRMLAQDLLKIYRTYERAALRPMDEELRNFFRLLVSKIIVLEEHHFKGFSQEKGEEDHVMGLFSEKRKEIMDSYLSGDYQGVIDRAIEIKNIFGPDSLLPDIGLVFAVSLAKRGMVDEALRVGTKISDDLDRMPGVIELRARMVEWQVALGDGKGAVRSYEKLVDNLHESEAVLKAAERKLSGDLQGRTFREKQEESPLTEDLTKESPSLQAVLNQVDTLVQKNEFDAAKLLLLRLALRLQDGPEAALVEQAIKSVELAEGRVHAQELSDKLKKRETLELAMNLIEQEKYEEAVNRIEGTVWGKEFGPEAKQLQDLAVEKIVNRQRNEAAKLFLMARNTHDRARKEGFLIASYNILKDLVDRYPSTPLYRTINENMKRIEEELAKVRKSS
jgi:hypothetical protein